MHLHQLKPGEKGRILSIQSHELEFQLMKLGVLRGDVVRVTNLAPFRGPVAVQCNNSKVALRWQDAQKIELEEANGK